MLICDKCNAKINEGSKFCPQCGDSVDEKDIVMDAIENNIANVNLSFGYSSSVNYQKAIDICKNVNTYAVTGDGKSLIHKITLPITEVELVITIFDLVGKWKSSLMLINGKSCTKKDLTYYGVGCYRTRQESFDKNQHCFGEYDHERNIWGCKKLEMPIYPWGGGWLEYGLFDEEGIWHFDKVRIKSELDSAIKKVELCPILDKAKIYKTLDLIPDSINPKTNPNWEYDERAVEVDGNYKKAATGIKPTIKQIYYLIPDESKKPTWNFEDNNQTETTIHLNLGSDKEEIEEKSKNNYLVWILYGVLAIIVAKILF